jgi:hypothetical protein
MADRSVGGLPALFWGVQCKQKRLLSVGDARRCTIECHLKFLVRHAQTVSPSFH